MNEPTLFQWLIITWFVLSAVVFVYLLVSPAPYGRHQRKGWGPHMRDKTGWVLMELPAVLVIAFFFFIGNRPYTSISLAFLLLWQFHYLYRTFIFPALLRGNETLPFIIVASGFFFNTVNGYLNGRYLFHFAETYSSNWFYDPRFVIGTAIFFVGFSIHFFSDHILRNLRKPGETDFKVPHGGLFKFVSCPNYLGEMITWFGWAVATWSISGMAFFVWTFANLFPRALAHHKWYQETFEDYPKDRKAIIPFVI